MTSIAVRHTTHYTTALVMPLLSIWFCATMAVVKPAKRRALVKYQDS
ncbi:MAG: hypothetical protein Q4G13_06440 [Moraxella sp.]|nr:hypothetical protein [Moraxella sp.]